MGIFHVYDSQWPEEPRVGSPLGQMSSTHWTEGAYDMSIRGTAQQKPIPVKRPARLTWSKGGGPAHLTWSKGGGLAHGKPVTGMFAYSPFTAR